MPKSKPAKSLELHDTQTGIRRMLAMAMPGYVLGAVLLVIWVV